MIKRKSIILDIILTILTAGLFNLWVQYRQVRDINKLLQPNEQYSVSLLIIFSIITFGLYFIWHEFSMTRDLHFRVYGKTDTAIEVFCGIATALGLWFIVDSYQQSILNKYTKNTPEQRLYY